MNKQSSVANSGITETLTMIVPGLFSTGQPATPVNSLSACSTCRNNFIPDGSLQNLQPMDLRRCAKPGHYQTWVNNHPKEYNELIRFRQTGYSGYRPDNIIIKQIRAFASPPIHLLPLRRGAPVLRQNDLFINLFSPNKSLYGRATR